MGGKKRRYVFVNRHGPLPHRMNTVILARKKNPQFITGVLFMRLTGCSQRRQIRFDPVRANGIDYTMPWAIMALATFSKPAMLAPMT